jgi:quercetin dioxygenase-like cupin family protein
MQIIPNVDRTRKRLCRDAALLAVLAVLPGFAEKAPSSPPKDRALVVLSTSLPALDGDHLKTTLVEVNYGPGESSPRHSHPCAVVGYVVEGALRMRVEGEPERTYQAGSSFYEAPNGVHAVSANASATVPAKFVAYFVCDRDTPLSVDVPAHNHSKGK